MPPCPGLCPPSALVTPQDSESTCCPSRVQVFGVGKHWGSREHCSSPCPHEGSASVTPKLSP